MQSGYWYTINKLYLPLAIFILQNLIFIEHKQLVRFTMLLKFRVWNKITNAIWDSVMNKITTVIFEYMHMSGIMSG